MLHLRVGEPLRAVHLQVEHCSLLKKKCLRMFKKSKLFFLLLRLSVRLELNMSESCVTKPQSHLALIKWETHILCIVIIWLLGYGSGLWKVIFSWQQLTSQGNKILLQIENLGFVMLIRNGCSPLGICINPWIYCLLNQYLFATQINKQFSDHVAYRPDPEAKFIDAFTIDWSGLKFYAFPLIAIISRILFKIS